VKDLLQKSILVAIVVALSMSLLSNNIAPTLGLSLLATAVLVPLAYSIRVPRDLNSLVLHGLIVRLSAIAAVALLILPYFAARNSADASYYDNQAGVVVGLIKSGDWWQISLNAGTDIVSFVTALIYLPFGPTAVGMTFLSGLLGFVGSLCFVGAGVASLPRKNLRGYAIFVMMLPSIVFWSTLFGKESWVFFGLGITALGIAQWFRDRKWSSLLKALIGLGVVCLFRPYVALATALAFALTALVSRERKAPLSVTKTITVLLLMAPLIFFMWQSVSSMTGVTEVSGESIVGRITDQGVNTRLGGGSDVATTEVHGTREFVYQLPAGAVRLLFRPFPWEATSPLMFLAALDNLILIGILVVKHRNVMDTLRHLRTRPFAFFCVVLTIGLTVVFSTIPNLGLLMREKTQITPFLYVLAFSGNRGVVRRRMPSRRNYARVAWLSRIPDPVTLAPEGIEVSKT
jgi:hypothetical protein